MNTILVLTDFSDSAFHAARYACSLSRQLKSKRLILYHAYQIVTAASEIPPDPGEYERMYQSVASELNNVFKKLSGLIEPGTELSYKAVETDLAFTVDDVVAKENVDLVVMGISGKSFLKEIFVGSNTIRVVDNTHCPVLIVPPHAEIIPVTHAVFACDLEKVSATMPVAELMTFLDTVHASLSVVNVDFDEKHVSPETPLEISFIHQSLKKYDPSYTYLTNPDTVNGIIEFAIATKGSIIISVAKHRGFFEGLFHHSVTHKIAYNAPIPLLVLHEKIDDKL
ncbi:MAG: hypothetical protein JWQ38_2349 [Flavipsychrobacter sp.]|nr:hypothetical protein [Flavipsychrobacter sp.]